MPTAATIPRGQTAVGQFDLTISLAFKRTPPVGCCVCRKLDSAVLMMKAAKNRSGCDCAGVLNRPMDGSVPAQSPMGPQAVVSGKAGPETAGRGS
jgi:hypothetical protein